MVEMEEEEEDEEYEEEEYGDEEYEEDNRIMEVGPAGEDIKNT